MRSVSQSSRPPGPRTSPAMIACPSTDSRRCVADPWLTPPWFAASITTVRVGSTIGQYRILRKIGEGGMGVVFIGEHVLIGRKAAVKVLRPEISQDRGSIERFFNEARAT